jgi:hypothetical protein
VSSTRPTPSLTPSAFRVLPALASGCTHGHAMNKFFDELTGGQARLRSSDVVSHDCPLGSRHASHRVSGDRSERST